MADSNNTPTTENRLFGNTPAVPATTVTIGTDTIYPTDIRWETTADYEYAAHMQDHKRQAYLSNTTKTITIEWIGPEAPDVTANATTDVTVKAGSKSVLTLTNARVKSIGMSGRARELYKGTITLELVDA